MVTPIGDKSFPDQRHLVAPSRLVRLPEISQPKRFGSHLLQHGQHLAVRRSLGRGQRSPSL